MLKTILRFLLGSVLLFVAQACAVPGSTTPDPNVIDTAIAGTRAAALTQTAQPGIPITGPESPTPTVTRAASATPVFTFTPVVLGPTQIRVSVATNCRVGPGEAYARVGALLVGEVAEVVGRNANGDHWIIRNPDRPGETCWLWGGYATLTGVTGILPVFTPPPTPTPSPTSTASRTPTSTPTSTAPNFAAAYSGLESCTGTGSWIEIRLRNTGGITFRSISMIVRDTTTGTDLVLHSDDFTNRNGCTETNTRDNLAPGANRTVSSPVFTVDPSGRALRATVTLCSNPGQSGTCLTQSIDITP